MLLHEEEEEEETAEEEAASGGAESGEEEEEAGLRSAAAILSPSSEPEPGPPELPPPPPPPPPRPPPAASLGPAEQASGRREGRGGSRAPSGSSSRSLLPRSSPHGYAQRLGRAGASYRRPGEACRRRLWPGRGWGGFVWGWGRLELGYETGDGTAPGLTDPGELIKWERSSRL